ncbi:MAG: sulfurtransferase [Methyloversatilis sp.]|nr:sulfurtransferase [Methyloversatilis sp.]MBP6193955.1 sulfurtransferase [Methyloversatilis sp.]MBP9116926.1 sulfurtransferase [Methyloversatilis sp.]
MKNVIIAAAIALASLTASAADLAITAADTFAKVRQADSRVLFVDVRDPVEIMFVGFTDAVHVNVPYLIVDRNAWNAEKGVFKTYQNPEFAARIKAELDKRGWGVDTEIITMCRSGSERGEPSASFLRNNGFPNARFVEHGFQGAVIKDGPQAGFRLQNGWQNSGLPWSMKMNPDKMYRSDRK